MQKTFKILSVVFVVAAIILISTKALYSQKKLDLFHENVDALADGEGANSYTCETVIRMGDSNVFYCAICDWIPNSEEALFSSTKKCNK